MNKKAKPNTKNIPSKLNKIKTNKDTKPIKSSNTKTTKNEPNKKLKKMISKVAKLPNEIRLSKKDIIKIKEEDLEYLKKQKEEEERIKKEKEKEQERLIRAKSKILKDFLTTILKEENAKQLILNYSHKSIKYKNKDIQKKKNSSIKKSNSILDYKFLKENKGNKIKYPLFQIFSPKKYNEFFETKIKPKMNLVQRPCRALSAPNLKNDENNKNNIVIKGRNRNKKLSVYKSLPLYLRIDDVKKKHVEEMEKLEKKYNLSEKGKKHFDNGKFEKWYNDEKKWVKLKKIKVKILQKEIEENKEYSDYFERKEETYQPKINKNTDILISYKYNCNNFLSRLEFYQNDKIHKFKFLEKRYEPSFEPYTNSNYHIKSKYNSFKLK